MRNKRRFGATRTLLFVTLLLSLNNLSCGNKNTVTIYRDSWGVPHIYAKNEIALAYGMGYAQAEDRLGQIMTSYRWAVGRMAEAFGPNFIEHDYTQRVWRHAAVSEEKYSQLPLHLQKELESFIAGIKAFMRDHPDKVPEFSLELKPWHPVALGRAFIWWWPLGQALDDYKLGRRKTKHTHGSNEWAVSGTRTKSGSPIALIDPHLSWNQDGHWFEVRLHGGKIHSCGISVVGTPFVGLGHNRHLSWAATTGGPDCGDCYVEEINPNNSLQYRYENEWRSISVDTLKIPVKRKDGVETVKRVVERTHHGPIYKRDGNKAYVLAIPYADQIGLVQQMEAMNLAGNLSEFKAALELRQFMPQNIMVADQEGNIYYQRTGRVPVRDTKYDWSLPVPGSTAATEWKGIHSTKDLVQILNPKAGFMQNCNISPGTMFPNSPMVASKYPAYIYNDDETRTNPRGKRAVALLSAAKGLTFERAREIAVDTGLPDIAPWQQALQGAFDRYGNQFQDIKKAVNLIIQWNGHVNKENTGATMYRAWRSALEKRRAPVIQELGSLKSAQKRNLLLSVRDAKKYLLATFGKDEVKWGETVILKRGDKSYPLGGGSFENGIQSLRAVWGDSKNGVTIGAGGQSGTMVVILSKPIKSVGVLPWGESDDPESPHYMDQGEKLFSQRKLKPTWFEMDDLKGHIESKKELIAE
ncbi:MAG: penicillin acylase family protein [Calditrichaeota bacterium]|nr:penicillin acylase family protein [Calditrichota bacterium]